MESRPFDDRPSRSQQQRNNRSSSTGTRRSDTQTIAADELRRSSLWSSTTQDPIDTYTTSASATDHAPAGTGPPYDTSVLGQLQADLRLLREGRIRDQQQHEAMLQERMRRLEGILESGLERQIAMSKWTSAQPDDFRREVPRELRAQRPTVASEYQQHQSFELTTTLEAMIDILRENQQAQFEAAQQRNEISERLDMLNEAIERSAHERETESQEVVARVEHISEEMRAALNAAVSNLNAQQRVPYSDTVTSSVVAPRPQAPIPVVMHFRHRSRSRRTASARSDRGRSPSRRSRDQSRHHQHRPPSLSMSPQRRYRSPSPLSRSRSPGHSHHGAYVDPPSPPRPDTRVGYSYASPPSPALPPPMMVPRSPPPPMAMVPSMVPSPPRLYYPLPSPPQPPSHYPPEETTVWPPSPLDFIPTPQDDEPPPRHGPLRREIPEVVPIGKPILLQPQQPPVDSGDKDHHRDSSNGLTSQVGRATPFSLQVDGSKLNIWLQEMISSIQVAEEERQETFRAHEEQRQTLFIVNEERREKEIQERLQARNTAASNASLVPQQHLQQGINYLANTLGTSTDATKAGGSAISSIIGAAIHSLSTIVQDTTRQALIAAQIYQIKALDQEIAMLQHGPENSQPIPRAIAAMHAQLSSDVASLHNSDLKAADANIYWKSAPDKTLNMEGGQGGDGGPGQIAGKGGDGQGPDINIRELDSFGQVYLKGGTGGNGGQHKHQALAQQTGPFITFNRNSKKFLNLTYVTLELFCQKHHISEKVQKALQAEGFESVHGLLEIENSTIQNMNLKQEEIFSLKVALQEYLVMNEI